MDPVDRYEGTDAPGMNVGGAFRNISLMSLMRWDGIKTNAQ